MCDLINLVFSYQGQRQNVLDDLNVSFPERGFVVVFGDSGSGKSTLLNLIAGRLKADEGQMMLDHRVFSPFDSEEDRNSVAYMAQEAELMQGLTVCDQILLLHPETARQDVLEFLKKVHLSDCANRKISKLSKGEKQRVSVALHMIERKKILLCDEITTDLDYRNKEAVLDLLKEVSKTVLVICVSHETELYGEYADAIYRMESGHLTVLKEVKETIADEETAALTPSLKKTDRIRILLKNHPFHHARTFLTVFLCLLTMFLGCLSYFRIDEHLQNAVVFRSDYALCNNVLVAEDDGNRPERFAFQDSSLFYMESFNIRQNFYFDESPVFCESCSDAFATLSFFREDLIFGQWTEDASAVYVGVDPEYYEEQSMEADYNRRFTDKAGQKSYYIAGFFAVPWRKNTYRKNKLVLSFKERPSCLKPVLVDANGTPFYYDLSDREDAVLTLPEGMDALYVKTVVGREKLDFGSSEIHRGNAIRIPYGIMTDILKDLPVPKMFFYDRREDKKADASKIKCIDHERLVVRENIGNAGDDINLFIQLAIIASSFVFVALLNLALNSGDKRWKEDMETWRILQKNDAEIASLNRKIWLIVKGSAWVLFWGIVLLMNRFSSFSLLNGAFGISLCYLFSLGLMRAVRKLYD